jgi:hypothetical protein
MHHHHHQGPPPLLETYIDLEELGDIYLNDLDYEIDMLSPLLPARPSLHHHFENGPPSSTTLTAPPSQSVTPNANSPSFTPTPLNSNPSSETPGSRNPPFFYDIYEPPDMSLFLVEEGLLMDHHGNYNDDQNRFAVNFDMEYGKLEVQNLVQDHQYPEHNRFSKEDLQSFDPKNHPFPIDMSALVGAVPNIDDSDMQDELVSCYSLTQSSQMLPYLVDQEDPSLPTTVSPSMVQTQSSSNLQNDGSNSSSLPPRIHSTKSPKFQSQISNPIPIPSRRASRHSISSFQSYSTDIPPPPPPSLASQSFNTDLPPPPSLAAQYAPLDQSLPSGSSRKKTSRKGSLCYSTDDNISMVSHTY